MGSLIQESTQDLLPSQFLQKPFWNLQAKKALVHTINKFQNIEKVVSTLKMAGGTNTN